MADIRSNEVEREYFPPPSGDMAEVEIERSLTDMFSIIATPPDGAGRRIRGYRRNDIPNKNITWMKVWQEAPDGTRLWEHRVFGVNEWKIDSATDVIEGTDLHILTLAHSYLPGDVDPNTGFRPSAMGLAIIPGVWTPIAPPAPPAPVDDPTPCVPPGNRPYFRPNRTVTRGQLAKIQVLGSDIPHPPTTEQTFEDVPVGSTFHEYVEALYGKGAINGYPCTED